ncbi:alpha-L-fucosidase [Brachybacterium vulturis]|uniref:alpha-L-fucosidase n=1 Tax=Brachybacterium vulturis TaxID=2017484 RepID=UPI0012FD7D3E|nr:alpha-L-fucosidase [Brachybacterium vulturis]
MTDEGAAVATAVQQSALDLQRRQAWTDARFGVMVHWGISAIPAGVWKGRRVEGLTEWIQYRARIPLAEYRKLAEDFNPTNFDAREWVRMAAEAGAKYFVYTAKHHDGFAIYHSQVSDYNIVDATPFDRDPLAELAEACAEHGIMLGVYYSQMIDWEDPDAVGPQHNDVDFDPATGDFHSYWRRKAAPQLREILTRYGDIGLMWFDMPSGIPEDCAQEAFDLVRELQPGAVINSRLGGGVAPDYTSMDDNYFNNLLPERDWETAATTNDSWAFAERGAGWKPVEGLCEALAYTVSRGGNLLLNVGPDATGAIPAQAREQYAGIGEWMQRAAPGIRGAGRPPFPGGFAWGYATARGTSLYLHVADRRATTLDLPGLTAGPEAVRDLATGSPVPFTTSEPEGLGRVVSLELAAPTDELPRTIELQFAAAPETTGGLIQTPGADLRLDIWAAESGEDGSRRWEFTMATPGDYRVVLLTKETFSNSDPQWWADGLTGTLVTDQARQSFTLRRDGEEPYPIVHYWKIIRSEIGQLHVAASGTQELVLEDLPVVDSKWDRSGANVVALRLERTDGERDDESAE